MGRDWGKGTKRIAVGSAVFLLGAVCLFLLETFKDPAAPDHTTRAWAIFATALGFLLLLWGIAVRVISLVIAYWEAGGNCASCQLGKPDLPLPPLSAIGALSHHAIRNWERCRCSGI